MKTDREIAEAATPGPWDHHIGNAWIILGKNSVRIADVSIQHHGVYDRQYNARHIAHFNPEKVLAMLDENERLKGERDEARCKVCELTSDRIADEDGFDITPRNVANQYGWDFREKQKVPMK